LLKLFNSSATQWQTDVEQTHTTEQRIAEREMQQQQKALFAFCGARTIECTSSKIDCFLSRTAASDGGKKKRKVYKDLQEVGE
jgi:hypothetical protein